jgi:hypothetical protein
VTKQEEAVFDSWENTLAVTEQQKADWLVTVVCTRTKAVFDFTFGVETKVAHRSR